MPSGRRVPCDRGATEARRMLTALRDQLIRMGLPAGGLSDNDLRAGIRRVVRDIDDGDLDLIDLVGFVRPDGS